MLRWSYHYQKTFKVLTIELKALVPSMLYNVEVYVIFVRGSNIIPHEKVEPEGGEEAHLGGEECKEASVEQHHRQKFLKKQRTMFSLVDFIL